MAGPTQIAVPIMLGHVAAGQQAAKAAVALGANLIEWRMDSATPSAVEELFSDAAVRAIPWILTVRPTWEGGHFAGDETGRLRLIKCCLEYHPAYLDIELKAWVNNAAISEYYGSIDVQHRPQLILSSHHFNSRPADLHRILDTIANYPEARVAKIAFQSSDIHDALDALELYESLKQYPRLQGVFIAMGEHGAISRTLAGKFGAAFTFATLPGGLPTASGQPTIGELVDVYRLPEQQPDWAVCGLVGWPVMQSVSPQMHNAAMKEMKFSGVYVRFPLPGDGAAFKRAVKRLQVTGQLNLRGLSITIPHKENAYRFVTELGGVIKGRDAGVINTILFSGDAPPVGLNTDAPGGLQALLRGAGWREADLQGRRAAIIGAGGAAAGLAAALAEHGCQLTIFNRTLPRAQHLAQQIRRAGGTCDAMELGKLQLNEFDLLVQCTPVGMHPHTDAMPIPENSHLRPGTVVMDTIYNPRRTKLLQWAAIRGGVCVEGVEMLVGQGALQFKGFTGFNPPIGTMHDAAIRALGI